jgi:hypothetical protein
MCTCRDFVLDIARLEHRGVLGSPFDITEPALNPALRISDFLLAQPNVFCFSRHHSKLLLGLEGRLNALYTSDPENKVFRVLFLEFLPNRFPPTLV